MGDLQQYVMDKWGSLIKSDKNGKEYMFLQKKYNIDNIYYK